MILEKVVSGVIFFYQFLIFVRVLLTWVNPDPYRPTIDHPLIQILNQIHIQRMKKEERDN